MNPFEHSHWLWNTRYNGAKNQYLDFTEKFKLTRLAEKYTCYISADANYALCVNGTLVSFGQYADYEDAKVYDTVDLTPYLQMGENTVVVTVHGRGISFSTYRAAQSGVIYSLFADDELFLISSDDTVCTVNPCYQNGDVDIVTGQLGFSYGYDATHSDEIAEKQYADIVDKPLPVKPRPIHKLTVGENQPAVVYAQGVFTASKEKNLTIGQKLQYAFLSTREFWEMASAPASPRFPVENGIVFSGEKFENGTDGLFVVMDLGEESTGILSLDIDVPTETDILIGYGEHLDDLRPRSYVGTRNFAIRYHAKAGRNTFVGPFLRLGLRYLILNVYADTFTLRYAGIKPTDYPLDHTPYFRCADHLHNKIYEVCVKTLEKCMHEHYEDCPWREQSLYAMDSRNQMLCGYYTFGETTFARESIRLMAQSLRDDGMLELCSPAYVSITIPSFTAIFVVQLEEYLRYSGDTAFAREMLPVARTIIRSFLAQLNTPEKLIRSYGDRKYWNFYEWQDGLSGAIGGELAEDKRPYDAPMNAFFSMALRAIAKLEDAVGDKNNATLARREKASLDDRIAKVFWNKEKQAFCSFILNGEQIHYAELTNALIAYADICPPDKEPLVLRVLAEKKLIPVTLSHSIFKYEALLRNPEKYANYVFEDVAKVYGNMVYAGATTFWETEEGSRAFGNAGSLCHGWSAIPAYLYFAYVLGLKPTENGYASYDVKPLDTGIYAPEGLAVTPVGQIKL